MEKTSKSHCLQSFPHEERSTWCSNMMFKQTVYSQFSSHSLIPRWLENTELSRTPCTSRTDGQNRGCCSIKEKAFGAWGNLCLVPLLSSKSYWDASVGLWASAFSWTSNASSLGVTFFFFLLIQTAWPTKTYFSRQKKNSRPHTGFKDQTSRNSATVSSLQLAHYAAQWFVYTGTHCLLSLY